MTINKTTKALCSIFFVYLFLFVISYSTFLQIPVVGGEALVWQSLIEQSITWVPFVVGYVYLYKVITSEKKNKSVNLNESKLLIPSTVLVFLIGMSIGVHFSSQIIEDALVNQKDLFVYQLVFFLDEQIGHLFLIPGILLSIVLTALEISRIKPKQTKLDIWIVNLLAILTALTTSVMSVEAGIVYVFSIPIIVIAYYHLVKMAKKEKISICDYPFNRYLIIIGVLTTLFSLVWWSVNGFYQPEELGLHLISF